MTERYQLLSRFVVSSIGILRYLDFDIAPKCMKRQDVQNKHFEVMSPIRITTCLQTRAFIENKISWLTSRNCRAWSPSLRRPAAAGSSAVSAWPPWRPPRSPHASPSSWAPPTAPVASVPAAASACPRTLSGAGATVARAARPSAVSAAESAAAGSGAAGGVASWSARVAAPVRARADRAVPSPPVCYCRNAAPFIAHSHKTTHGENLPETAHGDFRTR